MIIPKRDAGLITSQNAIAPKPFVGDPARNLKFVTTSRLGRGVIAQAERRGDSDLVIRIGPSGIRGRSMDDVEQILFHEVAHAAEWRLTSGAEWERETNRLIRWRERGGALRNQQVK